MTNNKINLLTSPPFQTVEALHKTTEICYQYFLNQNINAMCTINRNQEHIWKKPDFVECLTLAGGSGMLITLLEQTGM